MLERMVTLARTILIFLQIIEKPDYTYMLVTQHPTDEEIENNVIYVVGGKGYQKWAYFRCPTDRSEIIQLSLMRNYRPCWRVQPDWLHRPTIHPSVRQTDGSFAHFWIKRGKVSICQDSGLSSRNNYIV